jgi:selenocysteine lyase/cysteine desulfurase
LPLPLLNPAAGALPHLATARSQLAAAAAELASHVYGNPHCTSPSSLMVDEELKEARAMVLAHFSADPDEYAVVFTR